MSPTFFATGADLEAWLVKHHARVRELIVGFHRKQSGKPSLTYPEALDAALCFGWIDGVRRRLDASSYSIRMTPRRRGSIWSLVNSRRVRELSAAGRMQPPGLRAFEERDEKKSKLYSYEARSRPLDPAYARTFEASKRAWAFFGAQPPGYRRTASWWVMSAKKEETRRRRLEVLIAASGKGVRLGEATGKSRRAATPRPGRR